MKTLSAALVIFFMCCGCGSEPPPSQPVAGVNTPCAGVVSSETDCGLTDAAGAPVIECAAPDGSPVGECLHDVRLSLGTHGTGPVVSGHCVVTCP